MNTEHNKHEAAHTEEIVAEQETAEEATTEEVSAETDAEIEAATSEVAPAPALAEGETAAQTAKRAHNNAARAAIKGRGAKLADDAKLFPAAELTENLRMPESAGHAVMQVVLDNPGITVAEFKTKAIGGKIGTATDAMHHLRWDIGHGRLFVEFADGNKEQYEFQGRKTRAAATVEEGAPADVKAEQEQAAAVPGDKPKRGRKKKGETAAATTEAEQPAPVEPQPLQPQDAPEA